MNTNEFTKRRRRLMRMMGQDSIAVLPTTPVRIRNRDVEYPYRPDSDFYYLTGFNEPEAVMVLAPGREHGEYILFCRENDPEQETWHGRRVGQEGACEIFEADDSFPISDIDDILPGLLEDRERVFYTIGCELEFDQKVTGWINRLRKKSHAGVHTPAEFVALDHLLHDMRLYKSRSEVSAIRKAVKISIKAHKRAMQICSPEMMEDQIEAELLYEFMRGGSKSPAYPPIVAAGENGCILHYTENSDVMKSKELLLIDAGAEYDNYAADITRTFPVNGKFTRAQKDVYEIVLAAQEAAIEKVQPGNHWNDPHEAAVRVITQGLIDLGLLKGRLSTLLKKHAYKKFYMHRTGHWLGMDVHDVGDYKVGGEWRILEPGMVMTVEPGIYIPAHTDKVARKWWDIGIRIEDDVLVTRDGNEVLTEALPRTVIEIEELMAG